MEEIHGIPCEEAARIIYHQDMNKIKATFDERNEEILNLEYNEGYKVTEGARKLGISKAAISRRYKKTDEIVKRKLFFRQGKIEIHAMKGNGCLAGSRYCY